jgi:hypothetical protein
VRISKESNAQYYNLDQSGCQTNDRDKSAVFGAEMVTDSWCRVVWTCLKGNGSCI